MALVFVYLCLLNSKLINIQSKRYAFTTEIGNSETELAISETITVPSGYKAIGIIGWYVSHPAWVSIKNIRLNLPNTVYVYVISHHVAYKENISVEVLLLPST